jgi:hypothetical protein
MTRLAGRGQIAKMNFAVGVGIRSNADVGFGFVCRRWIAAVTFFTRHAHLAVRRVVPFKIAIAQGDGLRDLRVTLHTLVVGVIGIGLLCRNCSAIVLRPHDRKGGERDDTTNPLEPTRTFHTVHLSFLAFLSTWAKVLKRNAIC